MTAITCRGCREPTSSTVRGGFCGWACRSRTLRAQTDNPQHAWTECLIFVADWLEDEGRLMTPLKLADALRTIATRAIEDETRGKP